MKTTNFKIIFISLISIILAECAILGLNIEKQKVKLQANVWSKAYLAFKASVAGLEPGAQHAQAHLFGEALFNNLGVDGISVCDNSFSYGCYHSFLGTAIHVKGLSVVPVLNDKCIEKLKSQALGCQHGIGHGIMADLGYQFKDLTQALENCDKLPVNDPIGGCTGGVFMEYNFQTMLVEKAKTRSFDAKNPHYPCSEVSQDYQPACYFWQGQWWANVLPGSLEEKYQRLGLLCQEVSGKPLQGQCFLGAGNTVGQFVNWDAKRAISLCQKILPYEGQIMCRAGAAGSFMAEPKAQAQSLMLCSDLKDESKNRCLKTAKVSIGSVQ